MSGRNEKRESSSASGCFGLFFSLVILMLFSENSTTRGIAWFIIGTLVLANEFYRLDMDSASIPLAAFISLIIAIIAASVCKKKK